jgi:hypothetical protein
MTWSLYRWTWQLEASLYIGMPPAGSINRCRLYVPARALWGALTEALARSQSANFPDYKAVGEKLRKATRLGYLFPAEQGEGRWQAWLPLYEEGRGLVWRREDHQKLEDRAFRVRLLSTRPGTAIDPQSGTADEGTLREFELVSPYWRDGSGELGTSVALVGYVFVQSRAGAAGGEIKLAGSTVPEVLFVGGDTRYGLGKIRRLECPAALDFFGCGVELSGADPLVDSTRLLAHAPVNETAGKDIRGQQEILAGWDYGRLQSDSRVFWQPGSGACEPLHWVIREDGYWHGSTP